LLILFLLGVVLCREVKSVVVGMKNMGREMSCNVSDKLLEWGAKALITCRIGVVERLMGDGESVSWLG
jgi:hypothetical protein